jgi:PAS domain S-box-containing protein
MTVDFNEARTAEEQPAFLAQLRAILDVLPVYTWYGTPSGSLLFVNKRQADFLGIPKDHPLRFGIDIGAQWDHWIPLLHPDEHEEARRYWSNCLRTGEGAEHNYRVRNAEGDYRWFLTRAEPLRASDGSLRLWIGVTLDIEELKRAGEGLWESGYKLRQIVETVPGMVWVMGHDGETTQVNQRVLDYTGRPFEDLRRRGWKESLHPDDALKTETAFYHAIQTGTSHEAVHRVRRADGEYRWHQSRAEPLRDRRGRIVEWYGLTIEIDDRMKAEEALRESEYKLRQIIDTVPGFLWSADPAGEATYVNQHSLDYYGMRFEDFKNGGWEACVHPADLPETLKAYDHAFRTGTSYEGVMRLRRADGEFRWHHARCEPLRDRQGRVIQWYGLSVDIDERKKGEDLLRRSEAYLSEAERLNHSGGWAVNRKGERKIVYWSEESYRIFGLDPLQGMPTRDWVWQQVHSDDRGRLREEADAALREKTDYVAAFRILLPDGTIKYLESNARHLFSAGGELLEVMGTFVDVTERKRAEQTLRESEARLAETQRELRQMIDTIPILMVGYSNDARRDFVNAAWKQYTGLSDQAALGTDWSIVAHPDDFATGEKMWRDTLAKGEEVHTEVRLRGADGQYRWFAVDRVALRDESGKVLKWYGTAHDIEQRKRAEQALQESEARARSAFDGIAGLIAIMAPNGELETVNRQALEYFGRSLEQLKNWGTGDVMHPEDLPRAHELLDRSLAAGSPFHYELRLRRFDGEYRWFDARHVPVRDDSGRSVRWYILATEIEDRIRALARLEQMQSDFAHMNRVSTMGELVASLSHEITQPIASTRIYARAAQNFLDMKPPDLGEVREALARIVDNAGRAGDIIDRIRDQIRKAPPRKQRFDLNAAIDEVIGLGRNAIINNRVWVQTRLSEGLFPVHGDRVQLQQVVLNLLLNALEAMGSVEAAPRELLISTRQEHTGVLVAVEDSGPGIDPEHLDRVFSSFYTTKSSGTGMGLSICRSIIDAHGGRLWAEANEPRGAIFQFTLPVA